MTMMMMLVIMMVLTVMTMGDDNEDEAEAEAASPRRRVVLLWGKFPNINLAEGQELINLDDGSDDHHPEE